MNLSAIERQILLNQNKILFELTQEEDYETNVEILDSGHKAFYDRVVSVDPNEYSVEDFEETQKIMNMFRRINNAIGGLSEEELNQLNIDRLRFRGFDGNNDSHYFILKFMINKLNLWEEHRGRNINSHSGLELMAYRRLLQYIEDLGYPRMNNLTFEDLQHLEGLV